MPLGAALALIWAVICGIAMGAGTMVVAGDDLAFALKWFLGWAIAWVAITALIFVAFPV